MTAKTSNPNRQDLPPVQPDDALLRHIRVPVQPGAEVQDSTWGEWDDAVQQQDEAGEGR